MIMKLYEGHNKHNKRTYVCVRQHMSYYLGTLKSLFYYAALLHIIIIVIGFFVFLSIAYGDTLWIINMLIIRCILLFNFTPRHFCLLCNFVILNIFIFLPSFELLSLYYPIIIGVLPFPVTSILFLKLVVYAINES